MQVIVRCVRNHKNSSYILCSEDYELPFHNTIDVLCYFGILHHTKNKSDNIQKDKRLLRKNGYLILAEAVDRPSGALGICVFDKEYGMKIGCIWVEGIQQAHSM